MSSPCWMAALDARDNGDSERINCIFEKFKFLTRAGRQFFANGGRVANPQYFSSAVCF